MDFLRGGRSLFGIIDVSEEKGKITISGVSAHLLIKDMKKIWNTSKIASAMFIEVRRSKVVILSFFALELQYILETFLNSTGLSSSKRSLVRLLAQLKENTWLSSVNSSASYNWLDYGKLDEITFKLLPEQRKFLERYEQSKLRYGLRGMMLAAAPGSGKTINSLALSLATKAEKVIIVSPKNAIDRVWAATLNGNFKTPQNPFVSNMKREPSVKDKYFVIHYEYLGKFLEFAKQLKGYKVQIILDESHNFNEINSNRTGLFLQLGEITNAADILWMSGTPIKALGAESIPLIRSIDPLFNKQTEEAFKKMYGRDAKRTLDILSHRMGIISYFVPKANVMSDKPIEKEVQVTMPNGDYYTLEAIADRMATFIVERTEYYKKLRPGMIDYFYKMLDLVEPKLNRVQLEDFKKYKTFVTRISKYGFDPVTDAPMIVFSNQFEKNVVIPNLPQSERKQFKDIKSVVKYPELKIRGECLGRVLMKDRMQCHLDMIAHAGLPELIESVEKKTLVFSSYVDVVDATAQYLEKLSFYPLRIYGGTNSELASLVSRFEKDERLNPVCATYQSLSTAVPMTMANCVILLNQPWRSYEREQTVARAHRIGQDKPVSVYSILLDTKGKPNISTRSADIMQWSKEQVDAILGFNGDIAVSIEDIETPIISKGDLNLLIEDVPIADIEEPEDAVPFDVFTDTTVTLPEGQAPDHEADFDRLGLADELQVSFGEWK